VQVFVAHAAPGSKTEQFYREIIDAGKPVYTFDDPANINLMDLGARTVEVNKLEEWITD